MITIYHLENSQSDRVVWMMEELNLAYELKWFSRDDNGIACHEYLSLHPAATAPIIRDGDLVLAESTAILEYVSHKYGGGILSVAPSSDDYPHYLYWMQLNNNLLAVLFAKAGAGESADTSDVMLQVAHRREHGYFAFLEQRLGESDFLAGGELSCADIMAAYPLTILSSHIGRNFDDAPNTAAYIDRLVNRPAYAKAMSIAGPGVTAPA